MTCSVCGTEMERDAFPVPGTGQRACSLACVQAALGWYAVQAAQLRGCTVPEYLLATELASTASKLKRLWDQAHPGDPAPDESYDEGRDAWDLLATLGHPR